MTPTSRLTEAATQAGKDPKVILSLYHRLREWGHSVQEAERRAMLVVWAGRVGDE